MAGTVIEIRPAEPSDEVAIRRCVDDAYQLYVERIGKPPAPMLDDYNDLIARGVVDVAVVDDTLAGLIVMWAETDHLYVDNIAVHPDVQGSGVGSALLAHADAAATNAGKSEIRLYTNTAMTENLTYYPQRGFVETHRGVEAGYQRVYYIRTVPAPG